MNQIIKLIILLFIVSSLNACYLSRRDVGVVTGGALGGIAGNAITNGSPIGTGIGAVGGAMAGYELSR